MPGTFVEALHGGQVAGLGVVLDRHIAGRRVRLIVAVRGWSGPGELGDELFDPAGETVDLVRAGVDLVQQEPGKVGVVVIETAVERFDQRWPLGVELPPGQISEDLRVSFTADERFDHRPRRQPEQIRCHRRQLDQRVLEQLLEALLVPGTFLDQLGPQPGVVPQRPDFPGWNEAGSEHASLVELRQPHRVELVGLRAARDLLDITSVDKPHRQPRRFEQVEERPPVVRGRLQHHPLHPQGDQVVAQAQDRVRHGVHLPYPGRATPLDGRVRTTDAHHPRRLGDVNRRRARQDPFRLVAVDLLDIVTDRLQRGTSWGSEPMTRASPGAQEGYESLIVVLVAQCAALLVGPHTKLIYGLKTKKTTA